MLFNCPHVTVPTTRPTTCDGYTVMADTEGYTAALGVTLPLAAMVIIVMAIILIIVVKQLKDARYTVILEPSSACCVTPPVY